MADAAEPAARVTGIVLAGGRSSRFGSDKLAASYRGSPLLHHAVSRLSEVCDDVVAVLAPDDRRADVPAGARIAHDLTEGEGPLAGLHTGLMAAVRSDVVVVAGGDMPDVSTAVIRMMLQAMDDGQVDAVALEDGGRARPLPCVLRTWPAAEAAHALLHAGRRRLRDVLDALGVTVVAEPTWTALDPDRRTLFDVDTPADLDAAP